MTQFQTLSEEMFACLTYLKVQTQMSKEKNGTTLGYQQIRVKINVNVNEQLNLLLMIPTCTLNLTSWMFAPGQFETLCD